MTAAIVRCPVGVAIALAVAVQPWPASATGSEGTTRVGILAARQASPALNRLKAHLVSVDLAPVPLGTPSNAMSDAGLRALALGGRVRAGLTLLAGATGIELWQLRPPAYVQRESLTARDDESDDQLMRRAVETLRARLLPLPAVTQRPPSSSAASPRPSHRVALRLAAGPTFSPGGLSTMGHFWLTPSFDLRSWLRVDLTLAFPLWPSTIEGPEGSADMYLGMATAGVRWMIGSPLWRFRPSLALGVGASFAHMRGQAVAPLISETDWVFSAVGHTGAGVTVRLPWRLHLHLDALVGLSLPRLAVGFAGRSAANWGQPFIALNLGLGVHL